MILELNISRTIGLKAASDAIPSVQPANSPGKPRVARLVYAFLAGLQMLSLTSTALAASASLSVRADRPGAKISPMLYGIFFEEINCAGDGGLYAELVRNRSFEDADKPEHWSLETSGGAVFGNY